MGAAAGSLFLCLGAAATAQAAAPAAGDNAEAHEVAAEFTRAQEAPQEITAGEFAAFAEGAGDPLSAREYADAIEAAACWTHHVWSWGENIFGNKLWEWNQEVAWCGDGQWITSTNRQTTWGTTHWIGWNWDRDATTTSQDYGVGWNIWEVRGQGKFCYVEYFDCVQQSNPWIFHQAQGAGDAYWEAG
ncbi:hypothetical protein [Streptomyces carpaticus]|uniref:Uncharacterized protein n=1 Tax=Streptomyces carpaticus TaxID=285558 RepID=A0ABV4ZJ93_9ACTN